MFQIGSTVMHPTAGVCTITDLRKEKFSGSWELYYCLQPVFDSANNRIYVPVNSEKVVLRQLISKAQINEILAQVRTAQDLWSPDERERAERYSALLKTDDHAAIVKMIAAMYQYKEALRKAGRKLHQSDERLLQQACTLIHQEFSYALGLEEAETVQYIMERIAA